MNISVPSRKPWLVLALIWTVFVVHGVDRSVVLVLLEPIRAEFGLTDSEVGLISGLAYAVPFALAGIPLGALADRVNRARMLALLLGVWSLFTGLAGLAATYPLLLLARAGVGASEAGAPPTMLSLIGDTFDARSRPAALSFYFTAPFVGLMLGSIVAGHLSQAIGWRHALLAVGLPGLALAAIVLMLLREPRRGGTDVDADRAMTPVPIAEALRFILRQPELRRLIAAIVMTAFVSLAISSWIPAFLQRIHGLAPGRAGMLTALAVGLTGGIGSLIGGAVATRFGQGNPRRLRRLCGVAVLLSVPLAVAAPLVSSVMLAIGLIAAWSILGSAYLGPGWGMAIAATPLHMRSTVMGVAVVLINLIGAGLGPQSVGIVSDLLGWLGDAKHLPHAMSLAALVGIGSGFLYLNEHRAAG